MQVLTHVAGLPIYLLESGKREAPTVYLSAGVHGDEPAAAWGLLAWAQQNISLLRQGPFVISPCLNPIGLIGNTRVDHRGVDLNRSFHLASDEVCGPWLRAIQGRQLIAGLCLHEDYDAQGCYVYELWLHKEIFSRAVLLRCTGTIPADHRRLIDRRRAADGIIRRRKAPPDLPGLPEAIVLHQLGCPLTLTFETPSEFALDDRIDTQKEFLAAALSLLSNPEEIAR